MRDRHVSLLKQNELVVAGGQAVQGAACFQWRGELTRTFTLDVSDWLDTGDTLATATVELDGPSVTVANDTTTVTLTVSGDPGCCDVVLTTTAGEMNRVRFMFGTRMGEVNDYKKITA